MVVRNGTTELFSSADKMIFTLNKKGHIFLFFFSAIFAVNISSEGPGCFSACHNKSRAALLLSRRPEQFLSLSEAYVTCARSMNVSYVCCQKW